MSPSSALGSVIDACIDDGRMLEHESRSASPRRRDVLHGLAAQRASFVTALMELSGEANLRGRANRPSLKERGRELARSFRGVLGGPSDSDAVAACLRSCRRTESRYEAALGQTTLPTRVRELLVAQRRQLGEDDAALLAIQF